MLPLLDSRALRHIPGWRTRFPRGVRPRGVPRPRFEHLHRGVHHHPCRRLSAPERPWASPFKAFSSSRWVSLSGPLPSCRSSRRFAAPPWGAGGRELLQGFLPGSSSCWPRIPEGTRTVDAFLGFTRPEPSPPPSRRPAFGRGASPRTHSSGVTSTSACVTGSLGTEGSAGPSRDCRLSSGLSPCDRRGAAALGVGGGLMVSPHGSGALQAARTDPCPLRPNRPRG
jgi:hypothetical protein